MYTIEELADELNRQEWAVERMLKKRGYLKQNGDPRKSTIDDGYMNKNGLITKLGWGMFIDELGYKESEEEDDDDGINDDEDTDEYDDDESDEEEDKNENPNEPGEYCGWEIVKNGIKITAKKGRETLVTSIKGNIRKMIDDFENGESNFKSSYSSTGWRIDEWMDTANECIEFTATKNGKTLTAYDLDDLYALIEEQDYIEECNNNDNDNDDDYDGYLGDEAEREFMGLNEDSDWDDSNDPD